MKVTNDMIDKVTEVCADVGLKTHHLYETALAEFLFNYLGVPAGTSVDATFRVAKSIKSQGQWQDAYDQYCTTVYGEFKEREEEEGE